MKAAEPVADAETAGRPVRVHGLDIVLVCLMLALLAGCGTIQYTVDDGRPVDEKLLADIRTFGRAEQSLRPAIRKSSELLDPDCDKQWELPIAVASSQAWQAGAERVAWVRALGVDERVTVIAATSESGLTAGDRIVEIDGYRNDDAEAMLERLRDSRNEGHPFSVRTAAGKKVEISPYAVCRGHVLLAPPGLPAVQDYHWLMSVHPLDAFREPLTFDEALWVVLWTQGLSEEAGIRMKTFHYGKKVIGTILTLASIASSVGAVANAAKAATTTVASTTAATTTSSVVAREVATQVVQQVGKEVGDQLTKAVADEALRFAKRTTTQMAAEAAANRAGLSGVSWIAGTAFDKADAWAIERMERLGGDPLGAFTLHGKLVLQGFARNAFVFDHDRLVAIRDSRPATQMETQVAGVLRASTLEELYAPRPFGLELLALGDLHQDSGDPALAQDPHAMPMESFPPEARGGFLEMLLASSSR